MIPHRDGTVSVDCSENCMAKEHVLVERDYEGGIFVWAVFGPHRQEKINQVEALCKEYLDKVDNESAFVLQPIKTSTTKGLIKALREDIDGYVKAYEEDEAALLLRRPDGTTIVFPSQSSVEGGNA